MSLGQWGVTSGAVAVAVVVVKVSGVGVDVNGGRKRVAIWGPPRRASHPESVFWFLGRRAVVVQTALAEGAPHCGPAGAEDRRVKSNPRAGQSAARRSAGGRRLWKPLVRGRRSLQKKGDWARLSRAGVNRRGRSVAPKPGSRGRDRAPATRFRSLRSSCASAAGNCTQTRYCRRLAQWPRHTAYSPMEVRSARARGSFARMP